MLRRTPLFEAHRKLGARLVDFGGWEMPLQYTSIVEEHLAVRDAAGLFDISHMGEVLFYGGAASAFLNKILTNNLDKVFVGEAQYTLMCNEKGGVVDDLYIYRLGLSSYLLVINALRIESDLAWLQRQLHAFSDRAKLQMDNMSDRMGAIAVQGPRVREFIDQLVPGKLAGGVPICLGTRSDALKEVVDSWAGGIPVRKPSELKRNQFTSFFFEMAVDMARTGYTGEDGFEVIAPSEIIQTVWDVILEVGKPFGIKPCGLGARDTLRTEMCYPLYGHELTEDITPIEAGLGVFVALEKGEFVGRSVLAGQKAKGVAKKLVAFRMTDRSAPPRPRYAIWNSGVGAEKIGEVTSGTQSPSLGIGIGMGYVLPEFSKAGTQIEIEIRGRRFSAVVVPKPVYRKPV
jgi:aminomethyltransferase